MAHHAATGLYERDAVAEIEGEISTVFWRNPHVRLVITRDTENGEEDWEAEFGSVNTLERIGISRDMVQVGERVTITGRPGRNGLQALFASSMTLSDGTELILNASTERRYGLTESALRDAQSAAPELRADIFRVWLPSIRPNTGAGYTEFPLTAAGRAAQAAWDPANDPALRCVPPGLPTAMDNPYPVEFVDEGDTIVLRLEEWDGVRTIRMSEEIAREPAQARMGNSVGRWEANTLIVETTDMAWRYIDDLGTPQSEDSVIIERFTLSDDGTRLSWDAQIVDPVNFTEPVTMEAEWRWVPGHEIKPFNCALPED